MPVRWRWWCVCQLVAGLQCKLLRPCACSAGYQKCSRIHRMGRNSFCAAAGGGQGLAVDPGAPLLDSDTQFTARVKPGLAMVPLAVCSLWAYRRRAAPAAVLVFPWYDTNGGLHACSPMFTSKLQSGLQMQSRWATRLHCVVRCNGRPVAARQGNLSQRTRLYSSYSKAMLGPLLCGRHERRPNGVRDTKIHGSAWARTA